MRIVRMGAAPGGRLVAALALSVLLSGCAPRLDESFDLVCLVYGQTHASDGAVVRVRHHADGTWAPISEQPLSRAAVLLTPGPFPDGEFQYITVSSGYRTKTSALWEVPLDSGLVPGHSASFPGRAVLLVDNNHPLNTFWMWVLGDRPRWADLR